MLPKPSNLSLLSTDKLKLRQRNLCTLSCGLVFIENQPRRPPPTTKTHADRPNRRPLSTIGGVFQPVLFVSSAAAWAPTEYPSTRSVPSRTCTVQCSHKLNVDNSSGDRSRLPTVSSELATTPTAPAIHTANPFTSRDLSLPPLSQPGPKRRKILGTRRRSKSS